MIEEIWLPVKGYEGLYEVSSYGAIKSLPLKVVSENGKVIRRRKGRVLRTHKRGRYLSISILNDDIMKSYRVHRLIALAFIPNPENKPYINHIDNNPFNNHIDNLEWVTQKENIQHATNQGRMKDPPVNYVCSEKIQKAKELLDQGITRRDVQVLVGISAPTICTYFGRKIKRGKWKES